MSLVDGTRWTERWDGSSYQLRRESVDIDSQLSLGTNQWLGVTLLPQDKDGNVLRGIVDFTVPSGSEERLVLEATLAASQGQRANRLTIRPKGSATGPIVLKLIDSVTGLSRTVSLDLTGKDEALPEG